MNVSGKIKVWPRGQEFPKADFTIWIFSFLKGVGKTKPAWFFKQVHKWSQLISSIRHIVPHPGAKHQYKWSHFIVLQKWIFQPLETGTNGRFQNTESVQTIFREGSTWAKEPGHFPFLPNHTFQFPRKIYGHRTSIILPTEIRHTTTESFFLCRCRWLTYTDYNFGFI